MIFKVIRNANGLPCFVIVSDDGQILATSPPFKHKLEVHNAIMEIKCGSNTAPIQGFKEA